MDASRQAISSAILTAEVQGQKCWVLGYCRALGGDLDLDGATTLLKGISTTNYEYEEWLRMLGTDRHFAQAQSCQREAVFGGALPSPLFANCGDNLRRLPEEPRNTCA